MTKEDHHADRMGHARTPMGTLSGTSKSAGRQTERSECVFSTDETVGEEISRLLHTWQLVHQYERQITELAKAGDRNQVVEDLRQLQRQLAAASRHIKAAADEIGAIGYALESVG